MATLFLSNLKASNDIRSFFKTNQPSSAASTSSLSGPSTMAKLQSTQSSDSNTKKIAIEPNASSPPNRSSQSKAKPKPVKEVSPNENKRASSNAKSSSSKSTSSPPRKSRVRRYDSDSDGEAANTKPKSKPSKRPADASLVSTPATTESAAPEQPKQKRKRKRNLQETPESIETPPQNSDDGVGIDGGIIEDTPPTPPTKKRRAYPKKRPEVTFEDGTFLSVS